MTTDLISFKDFLTESNTHTGNYVATHVAPISPAIMANLGFLNDLGGKATPVLHSTVIYSPTSDVPDEKINEVLEYYNTSRTIRVIQVLHTACFDDLPRDDGSRAGELCTIVLKLGQPSILDTVHDEMKKLGMKHTYPDFSPHVSLRYGVPKEQAHQAAKLIDEIIMMNSANALKYVTWTDFYCNKIIKNWAGT